MSAVKASRRQSGSPGPTRRERAQATRRRIIEAAVVRFRDHGYAASTMETIAADARVAVPTVYLTFRTKAALLLAAVTIVGGEPGEPESLVDRTWFRDVMAATSGVRRLALVVELGNEVYRRVAPMMSAIHAAAAVDPGVELAWRDLEARRREGMRQAIDVFTRRDELRRGLDPSVALDVLFGVHRMETYVAFTEGCGWSIERYKAWQFATLARQLLPAATAEAVMAEDGEDLADISFTGELRLFR